jgi:hypothetical protein
VTAINDDIFLFLSACPEASLLPTLRRVAGDKFEDDFRDVSFSVQETGVKTQLAELAHMAKTGRVPALTTQLRDPTVGKELTANRV